MSKTRGAWLSRSSLAVVLAGATLLGSFAAQAGACPPDQVLTTPRALDDAPSVGVSSAILHEVDLTGWRGLGHFVLRTRRLVIAVDGIVPYHTHEDRPSIVTVVSGEIVEHNAHCAVPIVHKPEDSTPEFGAGHAHWWENKSGAEVVLLSSDIVPLDMMDDPHM